MGLGGLESAVGQNDALEEFGFELVLLRNGCLQGPENIASRGPHVGRATKFSGESQEAITETNRRAGVAGGVGHLGDWANRKAGECRVAIKPSNPGTPSL